MGEREMKGRVKIGGGGGSNEFVGSRNDVKAQSNVGRPGVNDYEDNF